MSRAWALAWSPRPTAYPDTEPVSVFRTNARDLAETIRAGGTAIEHVTIAEYDDGALARLDADPPRALDA